MPRLLCTFVCSVLVCAAHFALGQTKQPPAETAPPKPEVAEAPNKPDPATGEIEGVPPGRLSGKRTERGLRVISNKPNERFTIDIPGKKFKPQHPERLVWAVDDMVIQILIVPVNPQADLSDAQSALLAHQKYENDHIGKGGWKETKTQRQWLKFPSGEPSLYWELDHPDPPGDPKTRIIKHLFASTLNGRTVVLLNAPVGVTMEEEACRKLLRETLMSLKRYEPPGGPAPDAESEPVVYPAKSQAILVNRDMATPRDRREPRSIVIDSKAMMIAVRMALEFEKSPDLMTELSDGQSAHMVMLQAYEDESKRILYWEPRGVGSFLSDGNNIAGVKAEPHPQKRKLFYVTQPEMKKVVRAVITEAQFLRLAVSMGDLKTAVREYSPVHKKWPEGEETSQPRLLRAGDLFLEMGELPRAQSAYAVCWHLHPTSSRALAGLADVFVRVGEVQPAKNFYRSATEALAKDDTLSAEQRLSLQRQWQTALEQLQTKDPP